MPQKRPAVQRRRRARTATRGKGRRGPPPASSLPILCVRAVVSVARAIHADTPVLRLLAVAPSCRRTPGMDRARPLNPGAGRAGLDRVSAGAIPGGDPLDFGVVGHRGRAGPAPPAVLDPAKWQLWLVGDGLVVDVHGAGVDAAGEREAALVVAGDEPGAESVPGGVRDRHRLIGVVHRLGDKYRAEGLLRMDAGAGRDADQDRGTVARPVGVPAREHLGAGGHGLLDFPGYPVTRAGVISGPIPVPAAAGSPTVSDPARATSRSIKVS